MPLLRSSRRVLLGEKITPADVFDAHSERVIAEGRAILCALSLLAIGSTPGNWLIPRPRRRFLLHIQRLRSLCSRSRFGSFLAQWPDISFMPPISDFSPHWPS